MSHVNLESITPDSMAVRPPTIIFNVLWQMIHKGAYHLIFFRPMLPWTYGLNQAEMHELMIKLFLISMMCVILVRPLSMCSEIERAPVKMLCP